MAPNVTVSFWPANDINGTALKTFTDEDEAFKGFSYKPDLYGLGGWQITLSRTAAVGLFDNGMARAEVFVRFLIHRYSDTTYYGGGVLQKRSQTLIHVNEDGDEEFTFGGPGPKAYMERYRLGIEQLTGTGWNLDLKNGVWRWQETAPVGRILNRVIAEDAAQDDPALPDMTNTFSASQDSDSVAWTEDIAGSDNYETPIGTSLLQVIWELEDLSDLVTTIGLGTVASPAYVLNAYQTYGDDVSSNVFASGKVLLREGVNIANDALTVSGVALRKATHVIVEGKDGTWNTAVHPAWSSGEYVKWAKIEYTRSNSLNILEKAGLRWLKRQDRGDEEIEIEILPGADDTLGLYFPIPTGPLWTGNTIALDTSADGMSHTPLDYNNEDALVTGFELTLLTASDVTNNLKKSRSWEVKVKINGERGGNEQAPAQRTTGSGSGNPGSCRCGSTGHAPECAEAVADSTVIDWDWTGCTNPSYVDAFSGGAPANPWGSGTSGTPHGSDGCGGTTNHNSYSARFAVTPGETLHVSWKNAKYGAGAPTTSQFRIRFLTSDGSTIVSNVDQTLGTGVWSLNHGGYANWVTGTGDFLVPATAAYARVTQTTWSAHETQRLTITVAGDPASESAYCVDYDDYSHDSPYSLPSDYVIERFAALEFAVGDLELTSLTDVDIPTTPTDGDVLTWVDANDQWEAVAGGGGSYTDEQAQDSVGGILADTATLNLTYTDATPEIKGDVIPGGIKLDDLGTPDDNTDLDSTTSEHGLLPKLDGDSSLYLDGAGNWTDPGLAGGGVGNIIGVPSGAPIYISGLELGDRLPGTPGTYDEEFDGTADTLPSGWAWTSAPSGSDSWTLNSRWPSCLMVEGSGNTNYTLTRTSFTAAATFGIWMKFYLGTLAAADKSAIRLYVFNSGQTEGRGQNFRATGSHATGVRGLKTISSAESVWYTELGPGRLSHYYMGMTRDSNNWTSWISSDGVGWDRMDNAAQAHSFTIDRIVVTISTPAVVGGMAGIDWIRYRTDNDFPHP